MPLSRFLPLALFSGLLAGAGCSGSPVFTATNAMPPAFSVAYGLGTHDVVVGAVGFGTVMAVVDNKAFGFTAHRSVGELDIEVTRGQPGNERLQAFELTFDSNKPVRLESDFSVPDFGPTANTSSARLSFAGGA